MTLDPILNRYGNMPFADNLLWTRLKLLSVHFQSEEEFGSGSPLIG